MATDQPGENIAEANDRLEKLNHLKNHLLSLTSHQVKSPLAAIKGYATLLKDGAYGTQTEDAREILDKIRFYSDELINLVENVLDLKRAEEGKFEYSFARTDFRTLIEEVVESLSFFAESKNLELSFNPSATPVYINADKFHLKHVVQNLIDNALKYTKEGFVRVNLEVKGEEALFSVKDSGIGIPAGTQPLIFEEFVRDERVTHEVRGTGIGLHIAKVIVEAHGGKIWFASEGEGKGSTFYVALKKID